MLFNMEIYAVPCVFYEAKFYHFPPFFFVFHIRIRSIHCHRPSAWDR